MNQRSELQFRKGVESDIPFLVDTIVAAEKSGTDIFSYSRIFEMEEQDIRNILADILAEDAQGQELCFSNYLVAEVNGNVAGAVAAWIEGETGQSSNIIKGTLFNYFFPKENIEKAQAKRKILDEMHFNPHPGALVIDLGLTLPEYRGQGILAKMMLEQTRLLLARRPDLKRSQTQVLKTNLISYNICFKIGYHIAQEKQCLDPIVLQWLPSDTRIIFDKSLNTFNN